MDDPDLFSLILFGFLALFAHVVVCGAFKAFEEVKNGGFDLTSLKGRRARRLERLLKESTSVLLALSFADIVTTTIFILLSVVVGVQSAKTFDLGVVLALSLSVLILSFVEFIVREIWALRFAVSRAVAYLALLSLPLAFYSRLTKPINHIVAKLLGRVSRKLKLNGNGLSHQKFLAMMDDSVDSELEEDERAMIHSIVGFGETQVHEIMVPRIDMICVEESADLRAICELMQEAGHSRLPLYSEDVDHILGIVHVKDLLACAIGFGNSKPSLRELARAVYFVPETKKLDDLLRAFRQDKHHMAIVVDEYGGTAGLVTLEDVIEEIIGDIQDEYDKELPLVRKIDDHNYVVDAKIDLHELNESVGIELPTESEYDSLGGFILTLTDYVPAEHETVCHEGFRFLIEKVVGNRIVSVRMTISEINENEAISPESHDG